MAGTGPAMRPGRDSPLDFVAVRLSEDSRVANAEAGQSQFPGLEEVDSNRIFAPVKAIPDTALKTAPLS